MIIAKDKAHHAITTVGNQLFTPVGPFLRHWKLDELPQLLNVLAGHMSMIGPRPKMPEHVIVDLPCRPGITGAATIAFASEEAILDRVPKHQLETYFYTIVLPAKRHIDAEYMACATFLSDFKLLVKSALRRWDTSVMESLHDAGAYPANDLRQHPSEAASKTVVTQKPLPPSADQPASAEQVVSF
jgi:lipopolysaccharide/colanic/teichoic acid biosynthesis glycosyltransferase